MNNSEAITTTIKDNIMIIQCIFIEQTKGYKNYKPTYYKKDGENKAKRISHEQFMDLVDSAKIARPIYKDLA